MRRLGLGALLADDMGLGKTVQLIAYLLERSDQADAPALIVCPASVLGNWRRELRRFAPDLSVHLHHGPDRTHHIDELTGHDVVLTSYSLLPRDRRLLGETEWRVLVLDEAQQVKNPLTRGAQAARALPARHRIALTGTPIENRLDELWSILHFLNPGLLDTRSAFRRRYATPIERHRDDDAAARLRRVTGAVHPAPPQERPGGAARPAAAAGVERVLHADGRAGGALPGHDRRDAGRRARRRRDRAPRPRAGAADPAQAGLQPPGAGAGQARPHGRSVGQARPAHRDAGGGGGRGRQRAGVHAVRGDGPDAVGAPHPRARDRPALPGRLHAGG